MACISSKGSLPCFFMIAIKKQIKYNQQAKTTPHYIWLILLICYNKDDKNSLGFIRTNGFYVM